MTDKTELEVTRADERIAREVMADWLGLSVDECGANSRGALLIQEGIRRHRLATRTPDPTPVASPRTIYVQWTDNGNIRKWAWTEFELAKRLKVETFPVSDIPYAWAYKYTRKHPGQTKPGAVDIKRDRHIGPLASGWTETPLYAHPPAVPADGLVEALAELQLSAFLAGRGSVTGVKNGTRVAKPGPTMDDFRRMVTSALAAHRGEA